MKLRLKVRFSAYIVASKPEALELNTAFEHPPFQVKLCLTGQEPLSSEELPEEERHFRQATRIIFELSPLQASQHAPSEMKELLVPDQRLRLVRLLVSVVNRVLRGIRNFGTVIHIAEIRFTEDEVEPLLREWDAEVSLDDEEWQPLIEPKSTFWETLKTAYMPRHPMGQLRSARWPDIEEAIQDELEPNPEQEFLTNAIEHIRLRNYRLALLEAIVCLEIVLSQFLENYLLINKGFSRNRVKKVLGKDVGLTPRVGLLLDLVLTPDELKSLSIGDALKAINWRNTVVHKTGHLPPGLSDNEAQDCIFSVLHLADVLARKRTQIVASPESKEVAQFIALAFKVPLPAISLVRHHRRVVHFQFFISDEFPSEEKMKEIAEVVARRIQERDSRFKPEEHLYIRFSDFPQKTIAVWSRGILEVVAKPTSPRLPLPPRLEPPPKQVKP